MTIDTSTPAPIPGGPATTPAAAQPLVDVRGLTDVGQSLDARVTYHDSCSGLRELGIKEQPRKLLACVQGLEVVGCTGAAQVVVQDKLAAAGAMEGGI